MIEGFRDWLIRKHKVSGDIAADMHDTACFGEETLRTVGIEDEFDGDEMVALLREWKTDVGNDHDEEAHGMKNVVSVLALDLATLTGWAHSNGESGVQDFALRRGESPGMRFVKFRGWLNRFLDDIPTEIIAYEQAHHRGGAATHVLENFVGRVMEIAAERGLETMPRHTAEIKKHATGKGNANKPMMVAAAEARWWIDVIDDNHADALWLLDLVQTELGLL